MNDSMKKSFLLFLLIAAPMFCLAAANNSVVTMKCQILAVLNWTLAIVSLLSIKQFIWPGEHNRTKFQVFNMIFTIVFYWAGLTFIINHTEYFNGYEGLQPAAVIKRFFWNYDLSMVLQGIIVVAFLFNIMYVLRFGKKSYMDLT